jgi:hypothetical protein
MNGLPTGKSGSGGNVLQLALQRSGRRGQLHAYHFRGVRHSDAEQT